MKHWCWGEMEMVPDGWWSEACLPALLPRAEVTSVAKMAGGIAEMDPY